MFLIVVPKRRLQDQMDEVNADNSWWVQRIRHKRREGGK